ncbi:hypothetical protein BDR05DRAFT_967565 [Suillus weaverae]|nr:hypothetical protein BDR05DRAFT_967565 [Suillus weaverae]
MLARTCTNENSYQTNQMPSSRICTCVCKDRVQDFLIASHHDCSIRITSQQIPPSYSGCLFVIDASLPAVLRWLISDMISSALTKSREKWDCN